MRDWNQNIPLKLITKSKKFKVSNSAAAVNLKTMNNIKLFCDRIGHPSRFCLHFLQLNKIPHKEVPVLLLKGEPAKHPELPFGKVPVFKGTLTGSTYDEVVITESTTILKYLADKLPNDKWYPKNPEKRVKVDEFTDFFHFSMNAVSKIPIQKLDFQFSEYFISELNQNHSS